MQSAVVGQPETSTLARSAAECGKPTTRAAREPCFDSQSAASIGAIGVAPRTQTSSMSAWRSGHARFNPVRDGMYKSSDGGKYLSTSDSRTRGDWPRDCGSKESERRLCRRARPRLRPEPGRGVYRSRDAARPGKSPCSRTRVGAIDLNFDTTNSQIVYAAMWNVRRPPWFIYARRMAPAAASQINRRRHDLEGNLGGIPLENRGRMGSQSHHESQSCLCHVDAKEGTVRFE